MITHVRDGDEPPNLKYAVLHLQAAAEVLLKVRLMRTYWALVFKEPGTANLDAVNPRHRLATAFARLALGDYPRNKDAAGRHRCSSQH